jgi:hypothetical protein
MMAAILFRCSISMVGRFLFDIGLILLSHSAATRVVKSVLISSRKYCWVIGCDGHMEVVEDDGG